MGFEHELIHYRFLDDETDTCLLLDYDFNGPDVTCTIMGPKGREEVNILSLYIKREYVPPMEINWPKSMNEKVFSELLESVREGGRIHRGEQEASRTMQPELRHLAAMEDDYTVYDKPNLKPSINNPVYWIWWTIGATLLVGTLNLI